MAEIESLPCCLLINCMCNNIEQDQMFKDITKQTTLPPYQTVIEDILGFSWDFETKYYTCTVRLCKTSRPTLGDQQFADHLEAVVLTFDSEKLESWTSVNSWMSYLEHLDPSVKLLVCTSCTESSVIPRTKVQQWCIENEFELVELQPVQVNSEDEEDEFDVDGIKRILQVLHAHTWPNLHMKDKPDTLSPYMKQLMDESQQKKEAAAAADSEVDICGELGMASEELNDLINTEGEAGVESFEKLFSKLHLMKEKAENLTPNERKAYAERVAMSFWSAIGGSDDEIDLGESD